MNEREALIAAVRAQVEKERAAKAEKQAKEQEMQAGSISKKNTQSQPTQKFRPWNPDEDNKKQQAASANAVEEKPKEEPKEEPKAAEPQEAARTFEGVLGETEENSGLASENQPEETLENFGLTEGNLENTPSGGLGLSEDILNDTVQEKKVADFAKQSDETDDPVLDEQGNVINVIPVEQKGLDPNNVKSMYDIEFSDDEDEKKYEAAKQEEEERLAAEARKAEAVRRKLAELEEQERMEIKQRKEQEIARLKAEEEARRKAEEEARRKAEEEARRKAEEEARKQAEEEARRKAEEEARKQAAEEARRKAEEARKQAEEEARKKAEEEAMMAAQEQLRKQAAEEEAHRQEERAKSQSSGLPEGAKEFLGKYMTVDTINTQMKDAICAIDTNRNEPKNLVILCKHGFGTTNIGIDFAKSYYAMGVCKNSTVAVIKAAAFNKVDLNSAVSKLQGGCLVIENAGNVRPEKVDQLADVISNPDNDIAVILTGEIDSLSKLFSSSTKMVPYFKHLIQMHRIDNNAVYEIAKNYISQMGYTAEDRALSKLKNLMLGVEDGNLDRVLKMVNDAIGRAEERMFRDLGGSGSMTEEKILIDSDFE